MWWMNVKTMERESFMDAIHVEWANFSKDFIARDWAHEVCY